MFCLWQTILLACEIGILYTIGGNGYKWVRRFGIPIILGVATANLWVALIAFSALIQPYGDEEPLYVNSLTAFFHGIISMPLKVTVMNPITMIVVMIVMYPLSKRVPWFMLEILMGVTVGMQVLLW